MPVSPICLVNSASTTNGVTISPNTSVSVQLSDNSSVTTWFLQVYSTDELSDGSALSMAHVDPVTNQVTSPSSVVTFTFPNTLGSTFIFLSTVMGPGGPVATTFGIFTLTSQGFRVGAVGQTREGDAVYGWASILNPIIRAAGSGGGGSLTIQANGTPLTGNPYTTLNFVGVEVDDGGGGGVALVIPTLHNTTLNGTVTFGNLADGLLFTSGDTLESVPGVAQGDVVYFNGTAWVRLAPGTTGAFLQTLGINGNPQWASPPVGAQDNAVATRTLASRDVRILRVTDPVDISTDGRIPILSDFAGHGDHAGIALVPIGQYLYFSGYDTVNSLSGSIYGINLVTKQSLSVGAALATLDPDIVVDMTYGSWSVVPDGEGDILCVGGKTGVTPYAVNPDGTLSAESGASFPGGVSTVRMCFVGTGQQAQPQFAITATDGIVYIFDSEVAALTGAVAAISGFAPGPITFDDNGYVWVLYWNSTTHVSNVVQYLIDRSAYTLTQVQAIELSAVTQVTDITTDGRWLHALDTIGQHYAVDLTTGVFQNPPQDFFNESTDPVFSRIIFDGKAMVATIVPASPIDATIALRFHPDTTELLSTIGTTSPTLDQPRAVCADSGGQIITAVYTTTLSPNRLMLMFSTPRAALIENLEQPLSFPDGGRMQGQELAQLTTGASITTKVGSAVTLTGLANIAPSFVGQTLTIFGAASPGNNGSFTIASVISRTSVTVTNGSGVASDANSGSIAWGLPAQLDPFHLIAAADTTTGPIPVNMPAAPIADMTAMVYDTGNQAATNNITVNGNGSNIEDPNTPGTFSASVILSVNDCSILWIYTGTQWKIMSSFYPMSSGGGGVSVENNGSAIPNNPHSTLNLIGWLKAADSGSGVAAIVGGPTTTTVAYGTTTTLSATTTVLIVGLTGSGATTVNAPPVSGVVTTGWTFAVVDSGANSTSTASTLTVSGNGVNIEDPNSPGTFSSSVVMRINSGAVQWMYDGTHWKIIYVYYPNRVAAFITTTDSSPHAIFNYPIPSTTVATFKIRFVARDTVTIGASGGGEYYTAATNNGSVVAVIASGGGALTELTQAVGTTPLANLIWRFPSTGSVFNMTFDTSGGGGVITMKIASGSSNSTKWRVDIEAQISQ